jgi:hypothetical protein
VTPCRAPRFGGIGQPSSLIGRSPSRKSLVDSAFRLRCFTRTFRQCGAHLVKRSPLLSPILVTERDQHLPGGPEVCEFIGELTDVTVTFTIEEKTTA